MSIDEIDYSALVSLQPSFFIFPFLFLSRFRILGVCLLSNPSYQHTMTGALENSNPTEDVAVEKNGTNVTFNEQTNYVPKRTIITVSGCGNKQYMAQLMTTPRSSWHVPALISWH